MKRVQNGTESTEDVTDGSVLRIADSSATLQAGGFFAKGAVRVVNQSQIRIEDASSLNIAGFFTQSDVILAQNSSLAISNLDSEEFGGFRAESLQVLSGSGVPWREERGGPQRASRFGCVFFLFFLSLSLSSLSLSFFFFRSLSLSLLQNIYLL